MLEISPLRVECISTLLLRVTRGKLYKKKHPTFTIGFETMKRILLTLILLLVLASSAISLESVAQSSAGGSIPPEVTQHTKDWPLPNKDYSNTRFTADATINSGNVGKLTSLWSFKIPGIGAFGGGSSNPIIMGDNIYFQDLKANVFSLNLQDGHVNWQKIYNISDVEGPNGPAVGWGKVFVAKDLYTIAALNASTGEEIWTTKISNVNSTGIDIQPSVYDDMVYVSTVPGTGDIFYAPGGIGVIYALNQNSGTIAWNFSTVDSPSLWGHPEINSGGGCWYTPAIDVNRGVTYWGVSNPAPFPGVEGWPSGSSRPGPNLYTNSIVALDHKTGTMKWYTQVLPHDIFDHDLQIAPILASATITGTNQDIVIGSGKMGIVYAFNRDTGKLLWQTAVGKHQNDNLDILPPGNTRVLPGVLGGVETPMAYSISSGILYVPIINLFTDWTPTSLNVSTLDFSKGTGELVAIDVGSGNVLWNKTFNSINIGAATVVNDVVFTATYDGTIYAFKTTTGEQLFTYKAPAGINGWPAVAGNMIIWPAGVGANSSVIALSTRLTTRNFTLHGSLSGGWGFTPESISSPGPTIVVEKGDAVNLTLISNDGVLHNFFVSYTNTSSPNSGDPVSNDFTATTSFQFVATTTIGTYKYYCYYHSAMMWGYFQVIQTGTIPEFQPLILLSLLIATTAIAVIANKRRRQI